MRQMVLLAPAVLWGRDVPREVPLLWLLCWSDQDPAWVYPPLSLSWKDVGAYEGMRQCMARVHLAMRIAASHFPLPSDSNQCITYLCLEFCTVILIASCSSSQLWQGREAARDGAYQEPCCVPAGTTGSARGMHVSARQLAGSWRHPAWGTTLLGQLFHWVAYIG